MVVFITGSKELIRISFPFLWVSSIISTSSPSSRGEESTVSLRKVCTNNIDRGLFEVLHFSCHLFLNVPIGFFFLRNNTCYSLVRVFVSFSTTKETPKYIINTKYQVKYIITHPIARPISFNIETNTSIQTYVKVIAQEKSTFSWITKRIFRVTINLNIPKRKVNVFCGNQLFHKLLYVCVPSFTSRT